MGRVLVPGGQAVVSTWRGPAHNPFFATWDDVVANSIGSAAMEIPFSCGEPEPLRSLFAGAGFADVCVAPVTVEADFADPKGYVARQITASAAAIRALQAMDDARRTAAIATVEEAVAP